MDSWCESAKVPPPNIIIVKHGLHVCYAVMLYCGGWCPHERGRATTGVMSPLSRAGDTVWTNRIPPPSDQSQRGAGILNILSPVQVIVRGIGNIFELMNCHSTAAHCATSHGRGNGIGIEKSILRWYICSSKSKS